MKKIVLSVFGATLFSICATFAQVYKLSTPKTSLIIANNNGWPALVYYGTHVNDATTADDLRMAGLTFDANAYPAFGVWSEGEKAIAISQGDGRMTLDLVVEDVKEINDATGSTIQLNMKDPVYPVKVRQYFKAYKGTDIISTWTEIENTGKKRIELEYFASAFIPVIRANNYATHFHGAWGAEGFMEESKLVNGQLVISDKEGIRNTSHNNPSVMISVGGPATENSGTVFGGALAWSGNYKIKIDAHNNSLDVIAGINEETSRYKLDRDQKLTTPKFIMTYSNEGKGGVSRAMHRWARKYGLRHGNQERMILLNSWEGVGFAVNQEKMEKMMGETKELGGELFVMDDGWFGNKYQRNDATTLGDWMVDTKKLPQGIEGLTKAAKEKGIKFGIWIEPEMVNTKSELFEKHPKWALSSPNRQLVGGRGGTQLILDLTNPEVQDFVFSIFDNLMTENPEIAYIKWDANSDIMNYGSYYLPEDKQSQIYIDYQLGLNNVLERIRAKHPDVIVQACASGGGRVNYGLLPYFDEFWTSDDTDAFQRLYMQWGISHFYPAIAMASHVSVTPNHQTGRYVHFKFRFDVAMQGRLGIEMLPSDMSKEEKEFAQRSIKAYKDVRPIIQFGDQYRLNSPYDNDDITSIMYTSEDKSKAVFFAYRTRKWCCTQNNPSIRLDGVDPNKNYRITDLTPWKADSPHRLNGKVISGRVLKDIGIRLYMDDDYQSEAFKLEAVN